MIYTIKYIKSLFGSTSGSLKEPNQTSAKASDNRKILIIICIIMLLAPIVSIIPMQSLLQQFKYAKYNEVNRNSKLLQYAIYSELKNLSFMAGDWGVWDDTYEFVANRNQAYIDSNLQLNNLQTESGIAFVYIFNNNNDLVWGGCSELVLNPNNNNKKLLLEQAITKLVHNKSIDQYHGIFLTQESGAFLLSASSILPSTGNGSSRGTIVLGRDLDIILNSIFAQTKLDVTLRYEQQTPFSNAEKKIIATLKKNSLILEEGDHHELSAFKLLYDFEGKPILVSFKSTNHEVNLGVKAARYSYAAFLLAILLLAVGGIAAFSTYNRQVNKKRQELSELLEMRSLELESTEKRYRQLVENAEDAIYIVDLGGNILDANNKAFERLNYNRSEFIGHCMLNFIDPSTREQAHDLHAQILESGILQFESRHRKKDGDYIHVLVSSQLIQYDGQTAVLNIARDVSNRKKEEEELRKAKEEAETANKAKSIFLANMSHEIRTPMNAILGYVQLMKRTPGLSAEHYKNLDIINRSGNHLLKLINDILEMSKIEAEHLTVQEVLCNFDSFLLDLENMFRLGCQEKGLTLKFDLDTSTPKMLIIDEGKLRQIMINLLGNAQKFTESGGITVRVKSAPNPVENSTTILLTIDVEDSGYGIDPREASRIFEAFEQIENDRGQAIGTGLGLTISKKFARLLGGDLVLVWSRPNIGSLFRLTLLARTAGDLLQLDLPQTSGIEPKSDIKKSKIEAMSARIRNMPEYIISALREAVENGDMELLHSYINQLAGFDPEIAAAIVSLADDYEYTRLLQLLEQEIE